MGKRAERICFLGKNGIGKSVIVSNLSEALCRQGYRVLQIGNDLSLSSTLLLLQNADIPPVLKALREQYAVDLRQFIAQSDCGVYCMELGGVTPGAGCMARGIGMADELLESQGVLEELGIDYVLYDISGEIPCTGYMLPIRDNIMDQCIIMTTGSYSSLFTANNLMTGILYARRNRAIPIRLLVNYADRYPARPLLENYGKQVGVNVIGYLDFDQEVENAVLAGTTIFERCPCKKIAEQFMEISHRMIQAGPEAMPVPLDGEEMRSWARGWKNLELSQQSGSQNREYSGNT